MIATRAAEGLAAAFVVPTTLAMISGVFPAGPARNRAFGVWGGVGAVAGTMGLVAGGLLVSAAGWRWIFLINIAGAMTTGFHTGFTVSAALLAATAAAALVLLREDGRGQSVNLVELQTAGALPARALRRRDSHEHVVSR